MSSPSTLPEELVWEIIPRMGTMNEVVRYSSLLSKRWRNVWRSIDGRGRVLDFDKSDEILRRRNTYDSRMTDEETRVFADRVDHALTSLLHLETLDAMRIGFHLDRIEQTFSRWVEFGLTKRVKKFSMLSYYGRSSFVPGDFFSPESLAKHDLSRLEVLEFEGIANIYEEAVNGLLSKNVCPSLRRLALRNCKILRSGGGTGSVASAVIRVGYRYGDIINNLECLELDPIYGVARVELISAPRLHTFKFRARQPNNCRIEIGDDDLPRLQEALFSLLPWSARHFSKFGHGLHRLGLEIVSSDFVPRQVAKPGLLLFEKLRVLDLFYHVEGSHPSCFSQCVLLLRAAPMLRELSVWFQHRRWSRTVTMMESSEQEQHCSLEVLQLHGVHPSVADNSRNCQLELAAYVITIAPSLKQVVVDTRPYRRDVSLDSLGEPGLSDPIDARAHEAKVVLEMIMQLRGRRCISSHVNFVYQ